MLALRLDEYILEKEFNKQVIVRELTHVVRQKSGSLILENATNVRETISKGINKYPQIKCNEEVKRLNGGDELQETIESSYNNFGIESTIVICKSNKRNIYTINKFDIKYYGKKKEYL